MNENDLRDCFAMFAMCGIVINGGKGDIAGTAYNIADAMLEARKAKEPEEGIVAIKKRVRKS